MGIPEFGAAGNKPIHRKARAHARGPPGGARARQGGSLAGGLAWRGAQRVTRAGGRVRVKDASGRDALAWARGKDASAQAQRVFDASRRKLEQSAEFIL